MHLTSFLSYLVFYGSPLHGDPSLCILVKTPSLLFTCGVDILHGGSILIYTCGGILLTVYLQGGYGVEKILVPSSIFPFFWVRDVWKSCCLALLHYGVSFSYKCGITNRWGACSVYLGTTYLAFCWNLITESIVEINYK